MNILSKRIRDLERTNSEPSQLVVIMSFGGEDDDGNPTNDSYSVNGVGWGVRQENEESEQAFKTRAKAVAKKYNCGDLWDDPLLKSVTIGGSS